MIKRTFYLIFLVASSTYCLMNQKNCSNDNQMMKDNFFGQTPPGKTPKVFAPGIISTEEFNERDLSISPDGKQVFFSRSKSGEPDDFEYDILHCELTEERWTTPKKAWFSTEFGEVEPFFTPDGNQLFFNSNRPGLNGQVSEHWETWFITYKDNSWCPPKQLQAPFNRICHTTFTTNGKMYYTKEDELSIYRASYMDGSLKDPEKLDARINQWDTQYNSCIAKDESYLIYTRWIDENNSDLYISYNIEGKGWTTPKNLQVINSEHVEFCPSISNDGKYLFFSSNRNGNNDVYWVSTEILPHTLNHSVK